MSIEQAIRATVAETLVEMIPTHVSIQPEWMNTDQAAEYLSFHPQSLKNMRTKGTGPRYHKLGSGVRYRRSDLDNWVLSHPGGGS